MMTSQKEGDVRSLRCLLQFPAEFLETRRKWNQEEVNMEGRQARRARIINHGRTWSLKAVTLGLTIRASGEAGEQISWRLQWGINLGRSTERRKLWADFYPSHYKLQVLLIGINNIEDIASVCPIFSPVNTEKLMHAFNTIRISYCNVLLSGPLKKSISVSSYKIQQHVSWRRSGGGNTLHLC